MRLDGRAMCRPLAAAVFLTLFEMILTFVSAGDLFLSAFERWAFAFASLTTTVTLCLFLWALGSLVVRAAGAIGLARTPRSGIETARTVSYLSAPLAGGWAAGLLFALTSGRAARELPGRPWLVLGVSLFFALLLGWVSGGVTRRVRDPARAPDLTVSSLLLGVAMITMAADATVLVRLYPALHLGLFTVTLIAALMAAMLAPFEQPEPRPWHASALVVGLGLVVLAPFAHLVLSHVPNARYVTEQRAPITGKLARGVRLSAATPIVVDRAEVPVEVLPPSHLEGIDLRDRDVLLVTIDALRADRVGAYGGPPNTPHLDQLAREGMRFERAYTPAPHTSYALSSLLTGKYLRPVLMLPEAEGDHPTLPDRLRRYGYQTAAFYPPSVFYVDGPRFAAFEKRGFGFDTYEKKYARASERVRQLDELLDRADESHPLFVWVHLSEPHEPYDPPEAFARGSSDLARYDGEVAAADDAVGRMVKSFRAARPLATVIVTSDHGEEFGDHGGYYHGTTLHDEQVRVPLLWSSPGVVDPGVTSAPVEIIDVTTTLLAAVGVPRDARMRGDDLGPVLAGHADAAPEFAFAGIGDERMVTDGRHKAICAAGERACRVYDLAADPRERKNLGPKDAALMGRLRGALAEFVSSIARVESIGQRADHAWPDALSRAELGDPTAAPDVVPWLDDRRVPVRAQAARVLGKLGYMPVAPVLARMRTTDPRQEVRIESAVASLRLGEVAAADQVAGWLETRRASAREEDMSELAAEAALSLAEKDDDRGAPELIAAAASPHASEELRRGATQALGWLRARDAVPVLVELLADARLRTMAAGALGRIGDRRAGRALVAALEKERYLPARTAEARALAALHHPRTAALVRRFLGAPEPLPGGVGLLLELGALARPNGAGADLRSIARVRTGTFPCDEGGCAPGPDATVVLPRVGAPKGAVRAVFRLDSPKDGTTLTAGATTVALRAGVQEVAVPLPEATGSRAIAVSASPGVRLVAVVVAPKMQEASAP